LLFVTAHFQFYEIVFQGFTTFFGVVLVLEIVCYFFSKFSNVNLTVMVIMIIAKSFDSSKFIIHCDCPTLYLVCSGGDNGYAGRRRMNVVDDVARIRRLEVILLHRVAVIFAKLKEILHFVITNFLFVFFVLFLRIIAELKPITHFSVLFNYLIFFLH